MLSRFTNASLLYAYIAYWRPIRPCFRPRDRVGLALTLKRHYRIISQTFSDTEIKSVQLWCIAAKRRVPASVTQNVRIFTMTLCSRFMLIS